ncbi:MAG: hypothetical protein HW412_1912 [Bacteroidetes bacterium]|nr:hypothetical protein [Bacteroidota bacterium]
MAKAIKKKAQRQKGFREGSIPLARENYLIMGVGILSPILLVVGYCIIIPLGILYKKPQSTSNETSSGQKLDRPQT